MRPPNTCRHRTLQLAASCAAGLGLGAALAPTTLVAAETPRPPNVVFILADDLGCTPVGCYGNSYYQTPNIDRLAREGLRCTDAYSACPVCSPTRAALMTGKYPARVHVTDFIPGNPFPYARLRQPDWQMYLPLEEQTVAEVLQPRGYVTALFGKWHLARGYVPPESVAEGPDRQGFRETLITQKPTKAADPEKDAHSVEQITVRALQFLEQHRSEPFFLELSHNSIHAPIMAPRALVDKYRARPGAGRPENNPVLGAMMETLDDSVGRVITKLDELGLRENTLVIFYGDNGGLKHDGAQIPFRGGKAQLYEGGIRVPLIFRWPGVVAPGRVDATPITTVDFFPTMLELTGKTAPRDAVLDGISLASLLRGGAAPTREAIYWHYPHYHTDGLSPSGAIRAGDWKLIEYFETTLTGEGPELELFNLRADIGEQHNLAKSEPARVAALQARLAAWRDSVGAQMPTVNAAYDPARARVASEPAAGAQGSAPPKAPPVAFPGAEGYGRFALGGRGGDVYIVTNLNDDGPGSLRHGIASAAGPRTIVFEVSGTIELKSPLTIDKSRLTIAGQTAPGDGITLKDHTLRLRNISDVIIRFLRVRLGDKNKPPKAYDTITTEDIDRVMFDHLSASWAIDGIQDLRRGGNFTLQWSIFSEALNHSIHPEGPHAMCASFRSPTASLTLHHNLFATSRDRHPTLGSAENTPGPAHVIDFRNNVMYNWSGTANFADHFVNAINNYWRPGPETDPARRPISIKGNQPAMAHGFMSGNVFEGQDGWTRDNYAALDFERWAKPGSKYQYRGTVSEWRAPAPKGGKNAPATQTAGEALTLVLGRAGASRARDAVDARIVADARAHTGRLIDSQDQVGGWPQLRSLPAPPDADRDGMPDVWETAHGLNPHDAADRNGDRDHDGYTNLEEYLNVLAQAATN
jgi:arylsulfatase A